MSMKRHTTEQNMTTVEDGHNTADDVALWTEKVPRSLSVIQSPGGKSKRSPLARPFVQRSTKCNEEWAGHEAWKRHREFFKKSKDATVIPKTKTFPERFVPTKVTAQGLAIRTEDRTDIVDSRTFVHMIRKSTRSPKEKRTTRTPGHILDTQTKSGYADSTLKARVHSAELGTHLWFFFG